MDNDDKKYCIMTAVEFNTGEEEGISFHPDKGTFRQNFEKLLSEMTSAVQDIMPINQQTDLQQFINNLNTDSAPRFQIIVDESYAFRSTKEAIDKRLTDDFTILEDRTSSFEKCRSVYKYSQEFKFEDFEREHDKEDLEKIKDMFDKLSGWESNVSTYIKANEQ